MPLLVEHGEEVSVEVSCSESQILVNKTGKTLRVVQDCHQLS